MKEKAYSGCRYRGVNHNNYGSGDEASDSTPVALSQFDLGPAWVTVYSLFLLETTYVTSLFQYSVPPHLPLLLAKEKAIPFDI